MKRKLLFTKLATILLLMLVSVYSFAEATLIISKVADPKDHYQGRFVQLYNTGTSAIDLAAGNWYLVKQVNGGKLYDVQLTGTIAAGGVFLIATDSTDFNTYYDFYPNMMSKQINGNGDDGYFLYQGGGNASGTLVDAYGVMNEDGTGKDWEYKDGLAVRNASVNVPNATWTASEWTITRPANVADMNPAHFTHGSDTQAPTWGSGAPAVLHVEDTHALISAKLDEKGTVYYIVVPHGSDGATIDQVKAGKDYGSVTVVASGTIDVTAPDMTFYGSVSGLTASTSYDVDLVAEDLSGNTQTSIAGLALNTTAARSLTMTKPAKNDSFNLGDTLKVAWTSANIDSLVVSVSPVSSMVNVVMTIGTVKASDGAFNFAIPKTAQPGDYTLTLTDAYDTSYKAAVSPITVVDNRSLHLTSPKDNDSIYVGDTAVFTWTSSNIDSVLIGGYMSQGGPGGTGNYFILTGDPDHFDKAHFMPVAASAGVFKFYLPPDIGGSVKLDSVIIWDAADVYENADNPANIHFKSYAAPVFIVDTLPMRITHAMPAFGMTGFMPTGHFDADFSCDSIIRGTGNLYLKKADGTVVQTISAAKIHMQGSHIDFQPTQPLIPGQAYYIQIDSGFVKCADGSKTYPGLEANKWTFTVAASSLYFSEYIEGSHNNKALEIYNPMGRDVNLDDYIIAGSVNGSGIDYDGDVYHFPKGYVLKAGDVFVLANSKSSPDILAHTNDTLGYKEGGYVCSFNGDDARVLMKVVNDNGHGGDWMWVDAIGTPWEDPGTGWNVAGVPAATKYHTLLRKRSVQLGNSGDWGHSAGTNKDNSEWIVKDEDYFGNIGMPTPLPFNGITVNFNVDMHYAKNFDPKKDNVFIAGNFPGAVWNQPGDNPKLKMSDADSNMIYSITLPIDTTAMNLEYKYFVNAGWGGGEWDGGDNRKVQISGDTTLNDIFGYIDNKLPALDLPFSEDFTGVTTGDPLALTGWINVNIADSADRLWIGKVYKDNGYAQFSSYKSTSPHGDTAWLITPALNMDNTTNEMLSFDINVGYWTHEGLHVLVSTNFDQTKKGIFDATWTDITSNFTIPKEPTTGYGTFAPAGSANLSSYTGRLNIAFVYTGDVASGETTTYQIDNVKVEGTTGIRNQEMSDKVELYPNPGNGQFHMALNGTLKGAVSMRIVDITGRVVMEKKFDHVPPTVNVDISAQPSNMYFITLSDGHNMIVKKFMKR